MLQHVALEVRRADAERCADFWALLGFTRVDPPGELGERSLWLQHDGTQVHLLFAEEPVPSPSGHAALVVADYEATVSTLREAGFDPEPRPEHWGAARAFVRDPAGHRIEIMEFSPTR